MLRLPRQWVMVAGLLATTPCVAPAGPFQFFKSKPAVAAGQSERTNQQIANDIAGAIKQANLKGFEIDIEVRQGVATLSGQIATAEQRAAATKIASQVDGVQSVNNQLQVQTAPQPAPHPQAVQQAAYEANPFAPETVRPVSHQTAGHSNQQVAQQIASALESAGLGQQNIEVRYKDGVCSLIGQMETLEQAATAYRLAAQVPGVHQVVTRLSAGGREFDPQMMHAPVQPAGYHQQAMLQHMQGPQYGGPVQPAQYGGPVQPTGHHVSPHFGGGHELYNSPNMPQYAWPSYASYDNYAAVTYPSQYDASAWPYIGPFYPYPQVPLGWRSAQLVWDDGYWNLKFDSRTDKWWWFLNPENWH
jgi:osmotically-inducible protein OsmY